MDIPRLLYVVTHGEYSSYGISGVYSTEERARQEAGSDGTVEYYVLDEADDVYAPWSVSMTRDGRVDEDGTYRTPHADDAGSFVANDGSWARLTVWARTREQAIKAANERRLMLLATDRWIGGEHVDIVRTDA